MRRERKASALRGLIAAKRSRLRAHDTLFRLQSKRLREVVDTGLAAVAWDKTLVSQLNLKHWRRLASPVDIAAYSAEKNHESDGKGLEALCLQDSARYAISRMLATAYALRRIEDGQY